MRSRKYNFMVRTVFPYFIFALCILFSHGTHCVATTFISVPLTKQIQNASYIVLGEVLDEGAVRSHTSVKIPHIYWNLSVKEYFSKKKLGRKIEISQPGGQIGKKRYHIPGVASLKKGEKVILMLEDTLEKSKSVRGMQAGKYVLKGNILHNSLGIPIRDKHGKKLTLKKFRVFAMNALQGTALQEDIIIGAPEGSHSPTESTH